MKSCESFSCGAREMLPSLYANPHSRLEAIDF